MGLRIIEDVGLSYNKRRYTYPITGLVPTTFSKEVRDRTGISERKVKLVIKILFEVLREKLLEKESVRLPKIGYLFTIRSKTHKKKFPENNSELFTPPRTHIRFMQLDEFRKEVQRDDEPSYRRYYGSFEESD